MVTRKEQAEQTRQKILDATHSLICEEGIHSLSSLKIVQKAGISKGSFFHHFPQIEDLYLFMLDQLVLSFDEEISPKKYKNLEEFMRSSTKFVVLMLEDHPEYFSSIFYFLSQCRQKKDYQIKLQAYLESTFKRWTNDMQHFFPSGMTAAKKDQIVRILDMYFCGFSFHFLILQDKKRYTKISNEFTKMLIQAIES